MSQSQKHPESPIGAAASAVPQENDRYLSDGIFSRRIILQLVAIVGLSGALGFTFNAANPVGVRFGESVATPPPAKFAAGLTSLHATPVRTNPIVVPPPPEAVKVATTLMPPKPPTPPAPQPAVARPVVAPTSGSVSQPQAITNLVIAAPPSAQPNPAPIHWPEAKVLAAEGRAVLVDVRHKAMFDAGHIPGAISLPEASSPEEFKAFLSQQATNLTVVVYCSSTSCSQSARVANRLVNEFRWLSVRYMTGGYQEYQQSELANPAPPLAP